MQFHKYTMCTMFINTLSINRNEIFVKGYLLNYFRSVILVMVMVGRLPPRQERVSLAKLSRRARPALPVKFHTRECAPIAERFFIS